MTRPAPVLHLLCGKAASGKSTLAAKLGSVENTCVLAEDAWLAALFGDEMTTLRDYVRCAARLREAMTPHIVSLLGQRLSVVLDFPANTPESRAWMRGLALSAGIDARLHFLDLPDATCKDRLRARNASGEHPFKVSDAEYDRLAAHFVPPMPDEGFEIIRYDA